MPIPLIDKIKPKNGGKFPLVDAEDVLMSDGSRLSTWTGNDIPVFDLTALGLPAIPTEGDEKVEVETDTTAIVTALAAGAVRFRADVQYRGMTVFLVFTMHDITSTDGGTHICSCAFDLFGAFPLLVNISVTEGLIRATCVNLGQSEAEAPTSIDLSTLDTDGKIKETYADGTTKTTTMEFDADGNPVKITDGDGNVTVLTW